MGDVPGAPGGELAVETSRLTKIFGGRPVVDEVDLAIRRGSVYGLLGPNGAGKTTVIRILATLLRPDGGHARVLGHDVVHEGPAVRRRVSLTAQFASVDEDLTATENLRLLARLRGFSRPGARARAATLLEAFGLADAARRQVHQFSGGMRRRLDIAASIIVTPDLLFLDEPTTGLDPASRNAVWDMVRTVVAEGTTVLLTTQNLDEADQLTDRIAVIDRGRVIAEGTRGDLKSSVGAGVLTVRLLRPEQRLEASQLLASTLGVQVDVGRDPAGLSARVPAAEERGQLADRVARAVSVLSSSGVTVTDFALGQPSLDEVFLALTGSRPQADGPGGDGTGGDGPGGRNVA